MSDFSSELSPTQESDITNISALAAYIIDDGERRQGYIEDVIQKEELTRQIKALLFAGVIKNCYSLQMQRWLGLDAQNTEFNASFIFHYGSKDAETDAPIPAWKGANAYKDLLARTNKALGNLLARTAFVQRRAMFEKSDRKEGYLPNVITVTRAVLVEHEKKYGQIADTAKRLACHYSIKDIICAKLLAPFYSDEEVARFGMDLRTGEASLRDALGVTGLEYTQIENAVADMHQEIMKMMDTILSVFTPAAEGES